MKAMFYRGLVSGTLLVLAGCGGDPTEASKANFGAAIERFLAENGDMCLGLMKWPIDIEPSGDGLYVALGVSRGPQMRALEAAGIVAGTPQTMEKANLFGGPSGVMTQVVRYDLTGTGKKFYRETATRSSGSLVADQKFTDLCIGRLALDKVIAWEEFVAPGGGPKQARVTFTYKIEDLAGWVKDEGVRNAFRQVAVAVDGIGKEKRPILVKLTSEGWEVAGPI